MARRSRKGAATGADRTQFAAWLDYARGEYTRRTGDEMTQRQLAKRLELADSTEVSHWKSGRRTPGPVEIVKMAQLFGVDPQQIQVALGILPQDLLDIPPLEVPRDPHQDRLDAIERQLAKQKALSQAELTVIMNSLRRHYTKEEADSNANN